MGRTNDTYRNRLDSFIESFSPFRRALKNDEQDYLDGLWEKAHSFAYAGAYMNSTRPGLVAMMSMMVGIERDMKQMEERIEAIEEEIDVQG